MLAHIKVANYTSKVYRYLQDTFDINQFADRV